MTTARSLALACALTCVLNAPLGARSTLPPLVMTPLEGALVKVGELPAPFVKAETLAAMAERYAEAHQLSDAGALLRMAREQAEVVGPPQDRAWALTQLGAAYAKAGQVTRGLTMFTRARHEALRAGDQPGTGALLTEMALVCARAGLFDEALRMAEDVDDFWSRSVAVSEVCRGLARAGQVDRAAGLVRDLVGDPNRAEATASLARACAEGGFVDRGEKMAKDLLDPVLRARTLAAVAEGALAEGRRDRALAVARGIDAAGEPLAALYKSGALVRTSAALAEAGDRSTAWLALNEAKVAAAAVPAAHDRAKALTDVAMTHAEARQPLRASWLLDEALVATAGALPLARRVEALTWMGERCARAGFKGEAADLLFQATTMAKRGLGLDQHVRDERLAALAVAYLALERYDQCISLTQDVRDGALRADAMVALAEAALAKGRFDVAFDAARTIAFKETPVASPRLGHLVSVYLSRKFVLPALRIIRWIESPSQRAVSLAELGARYALMERGPTDEELTLIRDIAKPTVMVVRPPRESMDVPPTPRNYLTERPDDDTLPGWAGR